MSIAMLSAISLICADVAFPASALTVAAAQTAPGSQVDAGEPVQPAAAPTEPRADAPVVIAQSEDVAPEPASEPASEPVVETVSEQELFNDPLVFEGESDEEIVARLDAYLEDLRTLSGDFTQVSPSGGVTTGKFYLRRPGLLRFEYDPPTPLLIVANGGMVYVRDEALETTDSYPVGTTPLKFLLRRKVDLEDAQVMSVDRGVDNVAVTFASTDDETEGELTVIVSAPEMQLTRWVVRDIKNGITVVALDNVKSGERLANRLFETPDAGGLFLKN